MSKNEEPVIELTAYIKLKGQAAKIVYERQAEALKNGTRLSIATVIEKIILGK